MNVKRVSWVLQNIILFAWRPPEIWKSTLLLEALETRYKWLAMLNVAMLAYCGPPKCSVSVLIPSICVRVRIEIFDATRVSDTVASFCIVQNLP